MDIYNKASPNASFSTYIYFIINKDLGNLSDNDDDNNINDNQNILNANESFSDKERKCQCSIF